MNIAIVDDNDMDREAVRAYCQQYISHYYPQDKNTINIETFASGEELVEGYQSSQYDLLVLDIYMTGISGLETAKIIRDMDSDVRIIFLTSSDAHLLEGYRVFATGYFIKPLQEHEEEFAATFNHIFPKLLKNRGGISVRVKGALVDISYSDVMYVDVSDAHNIDIHLNNTVLSSPMAYGEVGEMLLKEARFLECHHRIIVNMDYIEAMEQEEFVLKNNIHIPISRRKRQDVKVAYMNHIISK